MRAGIPLVVAMLWAGMASAGPIAEFEAHLGAAHAHYRQAVHHAAAGERAAAARAVERFAAAWDGLLKDYGKAPPPHYSEDGDWLNTLETVRDAVAEARTQLGGGEPAEAARSLSEVRTLLADLRRRNGMVALADHLTAFSGAMDSVVDANFPTMGAIQRAVLREQTAVLLYLVGVVRDGAPPAIAGNEEFTGLVDELSGAVEALQDSLNKTDAKATEHAARKVKDLYAKVFLKFG